MSWEYLIIGTIIGIFLGILAKEAVLIFSHEWTYGEKLRIYDRERK